MTTDQIELIRQDFPIFNQVNQRNSLIYFDSGATSQRPVQVLKAMDQVSRECNANIHRGIYPWAEESTRLYEEARKKVQVFINAPSHREIIFTSGTTDSINLLAQTLPRRWNKGDEIILTVMEHHSNLVPWQMAAEREGLHLKFIALTNTGELDLDNLKTLWSDRTRLIAFTHISNVLGTINPAKKIIKEAHKREVEVLLDGAQSLAHIPINVQDLDIDYLAFSGHKMCGPTGIGVLYGKEHLLNKLDPWKGGGEMIRSVSLKTSDWSEIPFKFEAGTPPIIQAIGLGAAIDYLNSIGMEKIEEYEKGLSHYLIDKLSALEGIKLYGQASQRAPIAPFTLKNYHSHDLCAYLGEQGIALRAGHHCAHPLAQQLGLSSTARASLSFYNTKKEIDYFIDSLQNADDFLF